LLAAGMREQTLRLAGDRPRQRRGGRRLPPGRGRALLAACARGAPGDGVAGRTSRGRSRSFEVVGCTGLGAEVGAGDAAEMRVGVRVAVHVLEHDVAAQLLVRTTRRMMPSSRPRRGRRTREDVNWSAGAASPATFTAALPLRGLLAAARVEALRVGGAGGGRGKWPSVKAGRGRTRSAGMPPMSFGAEDHGTGRTSRVVVAKMACCVPCSAAGGAR